MTALLVGLGVLGLLVFGSLGLLVKAWGDSERSEKELWATLGQRLGASAQGEREMPWTRLSVRAPDAQVIAPGGDTIGVVQMGLMRVETTVALPDLVVSPENIRTQIFGLNAPAPIPTGTAAFDAHWRVSPVMPAGQGLPAAPAAYVSWARPDVLEALRLLDVPTMRVAGGTLTMALPKVNLIGVDLAMRTARAVRALASGQQPPALTLPPAGVVQGPPPGNPASSFVLWTFLSSVVLITAAWMLPNLGYLPGSTFVACPAGSEYDMTSTRSSRHRSGSCVASDAKGVPTLTAPHRDRLMLLTLPWFFGLAASGVMAG
ncbi:MAG: hypothetical protein EOO75_09835, partial [Myxococcales bacterium]